ncbi:MAG: class I SAM-dependent methyltransferase [Sphingomonadaceae bacterium]|nr:class I SAM-dependent methyltransferase [Sphingomonadaceae bacterium]
MRKISVTTLAAMALALGACTAASSSQADLASAQAAVTMDRLLAAVDNPVRPEEARKLDESRKPVAVLAFLGFDPGYASADIISGGGYWAEIMAGAVDDTGSVIALEPEQFYAAEAWDALAKRAPGITLEQYPFDRLDAGNDRFDFAILNLVYHDLYWQSERWKIPKTDPALFLKALYRAMKPGGIVGVIDHVGKPGDTRRTVDDFHRIDPAVVRADFEAAGFVFEEESAMLRNPEDSHEVGVFDPAIRGKTDRFVYRFRKPKN